MCENIFHTVENSVPANHFAPQQKLTRFQTPNADIYKHGIFATRAPYRPNSFGMSLVRLDKIENNTLHVRDLDILDGTPLLDIKPYIQRFDSRAEVKSGWQDVISNDVASVRGLRDFHREG
ncbi:MAG: TrmO family methyltransferase [Kiritimatiellae bacterium]|jgi:tRNA (Thr-GGU) A37 N-methylase|nr:TrmO family methyltransferase [Kiritimatiellia bacterium]MDD4342055.1 TrmO family methyltransferase [Kiritimatiellia bacterium]MDY0149889.1 TrmO family methyltransferase [Kiritimatiellia bacterium]